MEKLQCCAMGMGYYIMMTDNISGMAGLKTSFSTVCGYVFTVQK